MVLVNKIDSFTNSPECDLIQDYCNDNNIIFYGVSAKTGCNINESFRYFTTHIYQLTRDSLTEINGIKKCYVNFDKDARSSYPYHCCNIC